MSVLTTLYLYIYFLRVRVCLSVLASYVVLTAFLDRSFLAFLAFLFMPFSQVLRIYLFFFPLFLLRSFYLHHHRTRHIHPPFLFSHFTLHRPLALTLHIQAHSDLVYLLVFHPVTRHHSGCPTPPEFFFVRFLFFPSCKKKTLCYCIVYVRSCVFSADSSCTYTPGGSGSPFFLLDSLFVHGAIVLMVIPPLCIDSNCGACLRANVFRSRIYLSSASIFGVPVPAIMVASIF